MKDRTFTEEEIASLLERAAELQAEAARNAHPKPGLTLPELEVVARESGIDPMLIRQAAIEMDGRGRPSQMLAKDKTATHLIVERVIPGSLSPETWEDIVMELRHRFDTDMGKMMGMPEYGLSRTEQIGRSVEWKHMSMSGIETSLLIRPRGEQMYLRLSQRVGWAGTLAESISLGFLASFIIATVTGAIMDSGGLGVGVLLLSLVATIPLIYWADKSWRQKKHNQLDALADRVSTLLLLNSDVEQIGGQAIATEQHNTMTIELPDAKETVEEPASEGQLSSKAGQTTS